MHFSTPLLLSALATVISAQNPFSFVTLPTSIKVGSPFNITWSPSTGTTDTITLLLRQGDPDHLATVLTIADGIKNTGSYIWTPTDVVVDGKEYAFEIVDDGNKSIVNFSGQFAIDSPNTISSTLSTPAATGTASGSAAKTGTATGIPAIATGNSSGNSTGTSESTGSGGGSATKTSDSSVTGASRTSSPSASASANAGAVNGVKCGLVGLIVVVMVLL